MKANPEKKYINRVGLTVGKRIGGAVARSRAKRIIRHAYRNIDTATPVKTGHLVVIVAREGIDGKRHRTSSAISDMRSARPVFYETFLHFSHRAVSEVYFPA